MQPHPDTSKLKAYKILAFLIGVIALLLMFYLTSLYLESNFSDKGEAYLKGAGHLLGEDFWNAVVFLTTRHLLASTIICFMVFSQLLREDRRQLFKILSFAAIGVTVLVLAYTAYQVYKVHYEGYDRKDRIIEIALTWLLRILGFYTGYWFANTVFSKQELKHVS